MRLLSCALLLSALGCRSEGETKFVVDRDEDGLSDEEDCDDGNAAVGAATTFYFDNDRDGHGDPALGEAYCDQPAGYSTLGDDCADDDASRYPGADDVCDGVDQDCDGIVDNGLESSEYFVDADGDGYGDDAQAIWDCAQPEGTVTEGGDCNDADAAYNPGASEADCDDPNDYNCDGSVGYADSDADGFAACSECDDGDAAVNPDALEVCNDLDDDCDLLVDDADDSLDASTGATVYADLDGDGYGDPASPAQVCEAGEGWVADASDCDDGDAAVNPGATEVCNGADDDCDTLVDDADDSLDATTGTSFYADADADGYGDDAAMVWACSMPAGTSALGGDCNDADAAFNPGVVEADCTDATDYNCDGSTGYADADGDGFAACEECDDASAANYPGATESCDGADNDCDGSTDESDAVDAGTWYADADSDGYGNAAGSTLGCSAPAGYTSDATDCNDADATINPGRTEVCNGVDDDCDGTIDPATSADATNWYVDADGDAYGAGAATSSCDAPAGMVGSSTDCDDTDSAVNPAATELCDGIDNDCNGSIDPTSSADASTWYADADGDGYGGTRATTTACDAPAGYGADTSDCDDADASIHPGAAEVCDGADQDCDGSIDEGATDTATWYDDSDGDGYGDPSASTTACDAPADTVANDSDCDDADAAINPAATEVCDEADNDCDGSTDEGVTTTWYRDADGDSFGVSTTTTNACTEPSGYVGNDDDCNDADATAYPGGSEVHDGVDNDCDGTVDESWWTGTGDDGSLNVPAGSTLTLPAGHVVSAITGSDIVLADAASDISAGDEVLVINMHGSDAEHTNVGVYEFLAVASVSGSTVTLTAAPTATFGETSNATLTGQSIQLLRVPNYTTVTLGTSAVLTTEAWDGETGGVLAFRATGAVTIGANATIVVDELGYLGGETGTAYNNDSFQGESYAGEGDGNLNSSSGYYGNWAAGYYLSNYGGGGAMITGGGGNYGGNATAGDSWDGGRYPEAAAGDTYGDDELGVFFPGSGGAGVWYGGSDPGPGGNGGGILYIAADSVTATTAAAISAIGGSTSHWATGTWTYGAGGGAGGTVYVLADSLSLGTDSIAAYGGDGESTHVRAGGDGGEGRVRLDFNEINGFLSTASASTTAANSSSDPNPGYISTP